MMFIDLLLVAGEQVKEVNNGANSINKPEDDWTRRLVEDDPNEPMLFYKLVNLSPNSQYEVQIRAFNGVGWSLPNDSYTFTTARGECPHTLCVFALSAVLMGSKVSV